jgi:formylglycine-generating enzyme required for sulfatase activity
MKQQTTSLALLQACALALVLTPAAWAQGISPNLLPKPQPQPAPAGPSKAETQAEARARQAEEKARKAQEEEAAAKARIARAEARAKAAEEKLRAAEAKAAAKQEPATVSVREVQPVVTAVPSFEPVVTAVPSFGPVITAAPSSPLTTWDQWLGMVKLPINPIGQGSGITLGQANGGNSDEKPTYRVHVPYRLVMMSMEVSVEQYLQCVQAKQCDEPEWRQAGGEYHHQTGKNKDFYLSRGATRSDSPITGVSWHNARQFAAWATAQAGIAANSPNAFRLPTEAEWEYAARAGSDGHYSLGENNSDQLTENKANYGGSKGLMPVTSFTANLWRLKNMHGNVWEWVQDCYVADEYAKRTGSTAWDARKTSAESNNCPRVLRGGSWVVFPLNLRSAFRDRSSPDNRNYLIGFRLARMLP